MQPQITCVEADDRRQIALFAAFACDDDDEPTPADELDLDEPLPFLPHVAELAPVLRRR